MVCSRCKKRPAVVFITRMEGEKTVNDGLCLVCAKELGIKPVNDMLEKFGITDDDMEQMDQQLGELMSLSGEDGEDGFTPGGAPAFPFLQNLFGAQAGEQEKKETEAPADEKEKDSAKEQKKKERKRKFLTQYCTDLTARAREGKIDAIIAGMMDTAERRESINFSDPYKETIYSMMVLAGSPYENAASIQDFSGAAVLGQQGTALDDVIDQIEGVEHLSPVGSVPDMISRLQQGTCDAIVINEESAPGYLASNPDFRLITFSEGNGFTLPAKGSCVGLRKSDTELLAQINEILATIDSDARTEMWNTAVANQPK